MTLSELLPGDFNRTSYIQFIRNVTPRRVNCPPWFSHAQNIDTAQRVFLIPEQLKLALIDGHRIIVSIPRIP